MDDVHCLDSTDTSPMRDENINISDVIEVIETDPDFQPSPTRGPTINMYPAQTTSHVDPAPARRKAVVHIVEQPASKALRFRYECEGRSAGSIPGASSTPENKTFPSIQIVGYQGKAVVVVSCVTKDAPYKPHPHNLVGREGCRRGVCTLEISPESMAITFSNLGIQCVKKKDIENALKVREEIRVDPFKTGFSHRSQPTSIDLNAVRLCFQVFIESPDKPGKFTVPLTPIVSDPIFDKKAMSDLVIVKLSDCVSTVDGGRKDLILLCEKVAKEDIQVRFYEEKDGVLMWEGFGDFQPSQVHKQTAIWFKTPRYKTLDITEPVKVNIQLRRPSDDAKSEPLPFELLPLDSGVRRKRKFDHDAGSNLLRQEPEISRDQNHQYGLMNRLPLDIKAEPQDPHVSPIFNPGPYDQGSPYHQGGSPYHQGASPIYAPLPTISPNPYMPSVVDTSHQPDNIPYITYPSNNNLNSIVHNQNNTLPSIQVLHNNTAWNIPSSSNVPLLQNNITPMSIDNNGLSSIIDLDNNQILNSSELARYMMDPNNLSENLSNNLSLSDIPKNEQNMTDSLTRLAQTTYDNMYAQN